MRGNIEVLDAGVISGWLFSDDSPYESQLFYIALDGNVVASGLANIFRGDLLEAGIGNGSHGFSHYVLADYTTKNIKSMSILDSLGYLVKEIPVGELSLQSTPRVSYARRSGNGLEFIWLGDIPEKRPVCVLYKESKVVWDGVVSIDPQSRKFWLPLPLSLFDGQEHNLALGIKGHFNLVWSGLYKESQIAISAGNSRGALSNFAFSGDRASQRYRSLSLQMAHLTNASKAKQLQLAHDYLTDKKKLTYPELLLGQPQGLSCLVTVVLTLPKSISTLYATLMSLLLAYEQVQFKIVVLHDNLANVDEVKLTFPNVEFVECETHKHSVSSLISLTKHVQTPFVIFANKLQESCSNLITSLCQYLQDDDKADAVCAKLLANGSVIREAGITFDAKGEVMINGLGEHWLTPEFSYCKEVDGVLDAPVCFRTDAFINSVEQCDSELSLAEVLFSVVKESKALDRKVMYCPKALAFCEPGPLSVAEIEKQNNYPIALSHDVNHYGVNKANQMSDSCGKRILMFDVTTPSPDKDAGSYAAIKEIELMQSLGFAITFVPVDLEYKIDYTSNLQNRGVEVLYQPFFIQLDAVLNERLASADAVYITRYNVAEKVIDHIKQHYPQTPIIFNNADLHFLREIRTALSENNSDDLTLALKTRDQELAVIKKADVVVSYSDAELAVITSFALRQDNLFKCPWVLKPKKAGKAFHERQGIAFLGGYKHLPNVAAVDFFVTQVMPLIAVQSPHITLSIYGSNVPERFKLYESPNVKIVGYIEDLDELFHECRIFICPLIAGAGIKGKVLESLSYGVPTVLSKTAAEGTGLIEGLTTLIAEQPQSWVQAINTLYEDESLWQSIAQNQRLLCDSLYSFEHGKKQMRKIFEFANLL